jgi:hypothetical protein
MYQEGGRGDNRITTQVIEVEILIVDEYKYVDSQLYRL